MYPASSLAILSIGNAILFAGALCAAPSRELSRFDSGALRFEENLGQSQTGARFISKGSKHHLALMPAGGSVLTLTDNEKKRFASIRTTLSNANAAAVMEGVTQIAAKANYLVGDDAARWHRDIPSYSRVRYRSVYPGIDLVYYGQENQLEYDFVVAPGSDPRMIEFQIAGAKKVRVDAAGDLVLATSAGEIRWKKPALYQEIGGVRKTVAGAFAVRNGSRVRFDVGAYDRTQTLVIDPILNYSSYIGGRGNEAARGIAVDGSGNIYITGYTTSEDLPATGGTVQATYGGGIASHQSTGDVFLAKYTASGTLAFVTYLGGNADDVGMGIAVDTAGNSYITGYTNSTNFRTTAGVVQSTFGGQGRSSTYHEGGDAFVVKLNPSGNSLLYSTFVGGSLDERGIAIAIDTAGNAYVTGQTISTNFPVRTPAIQGTFGGGVFTDIWHGGDAFVFKLNPNATQLVYSTYLGGNSFDAGTAIAVDAAGNAYVGGTTGSTNFPVTAGAFQTKHGGTASDSIQPVFKFGDGFIAKINPAGTALVYSTFLGGSRDDGVGALAVDATGAVYVTGLSSSPDFPVTSTAAQRTYSGPNTASGYMLWGDGIVAKLNPAGSGLLYATYFGGSGDDVGWAIAIDAAGNAYVGGQTTSTNIKVSDDALQKTYGGQGGQSQAAGDGIFLKVNPAGSAFTYVSYMGGSGDDAIGGVALDAAGAAYVTGTTVSANFPVSSNASQKAYAGRSAVGLIAGDAFVSKIADIAAPPPPAEPDVKLAAVANAASYAAGTVSPGEIVILYGTKIGPAALAKAGLTAGGFLETTTAGTRFLFDGTPAPIVYVSSGQSAVIVPYSVAGKTTTQVEAEYQGVKSLPFAVKVTDAVPGLFSADSSGVGPGAIFNQDNSPNSPGNPAAADTIVVFFGTGEGQTTPLGVDGKIATDVFPKSSLPISITIGGKPVLPEGLLYFGAVPFQVGGLFQINAKVPQGLAAGNQEVIVNIGSGRSQQKLTVAVK